MKVLYTGPSGWDYYAWDKEKTIGEKTIHDHAIDLGLVGSVINENTKSSKAANIRQYFEIGKNWKRRFNK